jgi:hypothetical protein
MAPAVEAASCPEAVTVTVLLSTLALGETAFVQMDRAGIALHRDAAIAQVGCLNEQIGPSDAARFHRLLALAAFVEKDRERVTLEFRISRKLEPYYEFPEGLVLADHPIARLYGQTKAEDLTGEWQIVLSPLGGWSLVDGVRTEVRLASASAIIQIVDAHGTVVASSFVRPLDQLPQIDVSRFDLRVAVPEKQSIFKSSPTPWLVATGASLLVSGSLYTAGMIEKGRFENTEDPVSDAELPALQNMTNALGVAWVASSVVTAGLGVVTFTVVIPNHKGGQ